MHNGQDPINSEWILVKLNQLTKQALQSMNGGSSNGSKGNRSQISSRASNYSRITIDTQIKDQAKEILAKDSYMNVINQSFNTIKEEQNEDDPLRNDKAEDTIQSKANDELTKVGLQSKLERKKYQIAPKADQRIVDLQAKRAGQIEEGLIRPLQPKEPLRKEGRRLHISPTKYLYNDLITHDYNNIKERFDRRYTTEYPDYNNYQPENKIDLQKLEEYHKEHLHKTKISPDYIKKLLNIDELPDRKQQIIRGMIAENLDFRTLNHFRNKLFEVQTRTEEKIPIDQFLTIKNTIFKDKLSQVEQLILEEIKADDQNISLIKISDLIDLYTYLPLRMKKEKNKSDDLYYVMTSNQRGVHSTLGNNSSLKKLDFSKTLPVQTRQQQLNKHQLSILDIIGGRITERFGSLASAFRFFDNNNNQSISFIEFYNALDQLKVKISNEDALSIFNYLDTDLNNAVSYNEFCELSEEKRRGIDPFRAQSLTNDKSRSNIDQASEDLNYRTPVQPKNLYLSNVNIDDLDQMSRFQSLSSLKKQRFRLQKQQFPKSSSTLRSYMTNIDTVFGKKSFVQEESITDIINHNHLKDYLEDKISRNAQLYAISKTQRNKTIHNKSSELRSQSVARNIKKSELENQIEEMRLRKSSRNNISFQEIEKNQHKMKKDFSLPPISKLGMNNSFNGPVSSRSRVYLGESNNDIQSFNGLSQQSPTKLNDPLNLKVMKRNEQVLEHIHSLRMQVADIKEQNKSMVKPNLMSKQEKEDILSNYFQAKKQLNNNI